MAAKQRWVRVLLNGGMANQSIQFLYAKSVARAIDAPLQVDTSVLTLPLGPGVQLSPQALNSCNVVSETAPFERVVRHLPRSARVRVSPRLRRPAPAQGAFVVDDRNAAPSEVLQTQLPKAGEIFMDGYFQRSDLLVKLRSTANRDLGLGKHLENASSQAGTFSEPVITMHVRRGDYVFVPTVRDRFGVLSNGYYRSALLSLADLFPTATVVVVSDDPGLDLDMFEYRGKIERFSGQSVYDDMLRIGMGQAAILANSSYSWLGAFLGGAQKVLYPLPWFRSEMLANQTRLALDDWVPIPSDFH